MHTARFQAEDVFSRRWTVQAGYRMVEGGADVDAVYTFAWLHSAVLSVARSW